MKLFAQVTVSYNLSGTKKKISKCLVKIIHQKPDTILVLAKNDNQKPMEYRLTNNIEEIRTKFLVEGKLTLKLKSPDVYIFISTTCSREAEQIVRQLENIQKNLPQEVGASLTAKVPAILTDRDKELLQTSYSVETVSQFPGVGGTRSRYPPNLRVLRIAGLPVSRFDTRVLRLNSLSSLELDSLRVSKLPSQLEEMSLEVLRVRNCRLDSWPSIRPDSPLARKLHSLELTGNKLRWLPDDFFVSLSWLRHLALDDNELLGLPAIGLDRMRCLQSLRLAKNQLSVLPHAFVSVAARLTQFDLSPSIFACWPPCPPPAPAKPTGRTPASLLHLALVALQSHASFTRTRMVIEQQQEIVPRSLWLLMALVRRCFVCHRVVAPSCRSGVVPLALTCTLKFSREQGLAEQCPVLVYRCSMCASRPSAE